jgi:hypothetical protein
MRIVLINFLLITYLDHPGTGEDLVALLDVDLELETASQIGRIQECFEPDGPHFGMSKVGVHIRTLKCSSPGDAKASVLAGQGDEYFVSSYALFC